MGQAIPRQHPAVVPRSRYTWVRALLAVAMIAVAGLTIAVVILASDSNQVSGTGAARPVESIRYGDFNPATGRPDSAPLPQRKPDGAAGHNGGPDDGTPPSATAPLAASVHPRRKEGSPSGRAL
jgi:hypothetical protein